MKPWIYLLTLLVFFSACGGKSTPKEQKERIITVTIEPQRYFTEAIAGDKFKVVSLVPKGSSPESYDPTPRQLASLSESEAYLRIGHIGFELVWMDRLLENTPHLSVFDTSKGIDLIRGEGHAHGDHYHPGGVEPHVWNSAVNAEIIARNTFKALATLDKENEGFYRARHDSLVKRIHRTDSLILAMQKERFDKAFMIYHPALSYFARDYGLHQISIEDDGKEPSSAHLKDLIEAARFDSVKVVFVQPEFDQRNAEVVAKETGARIVPINPLSYDWEEEMLHIAGNLRSGK